MEVAVKERPVGFSEYEGFHPVGVEEATTILRPNAVGDLSETFQYPTSGERWDKVDDVTPDEDTTYVHSNRGYRQSSANYQDIYNLSDLPAGIETIVSIEVTMRWKLTAPLGGTIFVRIGIKTGGTVYWGSSLSIARDVYTESSEVWATNPDTGLAWTVADIDALQAAIQLSYRANWWGTPDSYQNCTQVYVTVTYQTAAGKLAKLGA